MGERRGDQKRILPPTASSVAGSAPFRGKRQIVKKPQSPGATHLASFLKNPWGSTYRSRCDGPVGTRVSVRESNLLRWGHVSITTLRITYWDKTGGGRALFHPRRNHHSPPSTS